MKNDDQSLFAWGFRQFTDGSGLLAKSPSDFANCWDAVTYTPRGDKPSHYSMTNKGLEIKMKIRKTIEWCEYLFWALKLHNVKRKRIKKSGLPLIEPQEDEFSSSTEGSYSRISPSSPILMPVSLFNESPKSRIYVSSGLGY